MPCKCIGPWCHSSFWEEQTTNLQHTVDCREQCGTRIALEPKWLCACSTIGAMMKPHTRHSPAQFVYFNPTCLNVWAMLPFPGHPLPLPFPLFPFGPVFSFSRIYSAYNWPPTETPLSSVGPAYGDGMPVPLRQGWNSQRESELAMHSEDTAT